MNFIHLNFKTGILILIFIKSAQSSHNKNTTAIDTVLPNKTTTFKKIYILFRLFFLDDKLTVKQEYENIINNADYYKQKINIRFLMNAKIYFIDKELVNMQKIIYLIDNMFENNKFFKVEMRKNSDKYFNIKEIAAVKYSMLINRENTYIKLLQDGKQKLQNKYCDTEKVKIKLKKCKLKLEKIEKMKKKTSKMLDNLMFLTVFTTYDIIVKNFIKQNHDEYINFNDLMNSEYILNDENKIKPSYAHKIYKNDNKIFLNVLKIIKNPQIVLLEKIKKKLEFLEDFLLLNPIERLNLIEKKIHGEMIDKKSEEIIFEYFAFYDKVNKKNDFLDTCNSFLELICNNLDTDTIYAYKRKKLFSQSFFMTLYFINLVDCSKDKKYDTFKDNLYKYFSEFNKILAVDIEKKLQNNIFIYKEIL